MDRISGNFNFAGAINFSGSVYLPTGAVKNASVSSGASDIIAAEKLEHLQSVTQSQSGNATAETRVLFVAKNACTVEGFKAGSITAATGAAVATLNLRKNGVSVLTGVLTLDNANAAYTPEAGTLSGSPTLAAGDVLDVVITAAAGGGGLPTGLYWTADIHHAGQ